MDQELHRRLAAEAIIRRLQKEYDTDATVNMCLYHALRGEMDIDVALCMCIQTLVKQNKAYLDEVTRLSWGQPFIVQIGEANAPSTKSG